MNPVVRKQSLLGLMYLSIIKYFCFFADKYSNKNHRELCTPLYFYSLKKITEYLEHLEYVFQLPAKDWIKVQLDKYNFSLHKVP